MSGALALFSERLFVTLSCLDTLWQEVSSRAIYVSDAVGRGQAVEKVIVRPVGGPKVARNKAKTLRNGVFQPLNRGQKGARRSFQHAGAFSEVRYSLATPKLRQK